MIPYGWYAYTALRNNEMDTKKLPRKCRRSPSFLDPKTSLWMIAEDNLVSAVEG